jgi:hypothetical protein
LSFDRLFAQSIPVTNSLMLRFPLGSLNMERTKKFQSCYGASSAKSYKLFLTFFILEIAVNCPSITNILEQKLAYIHILQLYKFVMLAPVPCDGSHCGQLATVECEPSLLQISPEHRNSGLKQEVTEFRYI